MDDELFAALTRDVREFNAYRSRCGSAALDFTRAPLAGMSLGGVDFSGMNLDGADLRKADLSGANLTGATLRGANLAGAYLSRAILRDADLQGACLEGSNLIGAVFEKANLRDANLRRANAAGANLGFSHIEGADLRGAVLTETALHATAYHKAKVSMDQLKEAVVSDLMPGVAHKKARGRPYATYAFTLLLLVLCVTFPTWKKHIPAYKPLFEEGKVTEVKRAMEMGDGMRESGEYRMAIEKYERAVLLDPGCRDGWLRLVECYDILYDRSNAKRCLEVIGKRWPEKRKDPFIGPLFRKYR